MNWEANIGTAARQVSGNLPFSTSMTLRHRDVILTTLCYFCAMTGAYGIAFWLPTILKRLSGESDLRVTMMAALPYVAAFVTQQVTGWHSDHVVVGYLANRTHSFSAGLLYLVASLFASAAFMLLIGRGQKQ